MVPLIKYEDQVMHIKELTIISILHLASMMACIPTVCVTKITKPRKEKEERKNW